MVQVTENWSRVKGRLIEIRAQANDVGNLVCVIEVADIASIEGYPNLLNWALGQTVEIGVKPEQAANFAAGQFINLKVRLAGPKKIFAHPNEVPQTGTRENILGPL